MVHHVTPETATGTVDRFLRANSMLDVDGMFAEIAEDAVWEFPTAPAGAPRSVAGWAENRAFFESLLPMWRRFRLLRWEVLELSGDPRILAMYESEGTLLDGSPYANRYLSLVTVADGRIARWVEFCDPSPLQRGVEAMLRQRDD